MTQSQPLDPMTSLTTVLKIWGQSMTKSIKFTIFNFYLLIFSILYILHLKAFDFFEVLNFWEQSNNFKISNFEFLDCECLFLKFRVVLIFFNFKNFGIKQNKELEKKMSLRTFNF